MNNQHKELAAGKWRKMPFLEQMANIGSEVERSISWREKKNEEFSKMAFYRSLELIDLTLSAPISFPQRKETARLRELWSDYFAFNNCYKSSKESWRKYFIQLLFAFKNKK
ncbi:hypothetical protein JW796_01150 [Candidatus Dojkabacteria bacterium]|nr:hypothetical protein [Candidatus Dojkabacteria bacterium]